MDGHGGDVPRHENSPRVSRNPEDLTIRSAVRKHSLSPAEVDSRFPQSQASLDFRVQIGVGLKAELQASFAALSRFTRSKRSSISAGIGYSALISSKRRSWSSR